jgi:hypothetical protein
LGDLPHCRPFLFFSPVGMKNFLKGDASEQLKKTLEALEGLWKKETAYKVIILVADIDLSWDGTHMAVVGGNNIPRWNEFVPENPIETKSLKWMFDSSETYLRWQTQWLKHMVPLHLGFEMTNSNDPDTQEISNALRLHFANLVLLYTADRTTEESGALTARFTGVNQSVNIPLWKMAETLTGGVTPEAFKALMNILKWAYEEEWVGARLSMLQVSLVEELGAIVETNRYQLLLYNAPRIYDDLVWRWKAFTTKKLEEYTEKEKALEDYIGATVQALSDQVSAMVKSLSDTMLATVAAFLVSFLAALFKDKFNPAVTMIGLFLYAAYVLIFPLGYNLSNQWERFQELSKEFATRRQRFENRLPPEKVKALIGSQVADSQDRFRFWFHLTLVTYLGVTVLIIVAAFLSQDISQDLTKDSTTVKPSVVSGK